MPSSGVPTRNSFFLWCTVPFAFLPNGWLRNASITNLFICVVHASRAIRYYSVNAEDARQLGSSSECSICNQRKGKIRDRRGACLSGMVGQDKTGPQTNCRVLALIEADQLRPMLWATLPRTITRDPNCPTTNIPTLPAQAGTRRDRHWFVL